MILGAGLALAGLTSTPAEAEEKVSFNRDIRPILADNCFRCHGPDARARTSGLRLDTREGALEPRKRKPAAVLPGKADDSMLFQRIITADPKKVMPPPETDKHLTVKQRELIKRWIEQGAEYQGHWAFIKPERPALPAVKNSAWVRNPIDRFVLARLEAEGLKPSAEADKITLIRRATLDLTGLPPTPAEVDAFLKDTAPDAYEKMVDRLLASKRFGEHMARYWLDLARYGDTHGLHFDNERALWKYREWVIRAYNENKPFSEFAVEQLAGDLLPNATVDQRIATGFNRCNVTTNEGGSISEEVLVRYAVDRTETMGTVFMGLTLGCAVCHDHKFDPIGQKEFYQLFAFFNSAADSAMDGNTLAPPPILRLPSPEQEKQAKAIEEQIKLARQKITDTLAQTTYAEPASVPPSNGEPREFVWIDDDTPAGVQRHGDWNFVAAPAPVLSGKTSMVRSAEGITQHFFTGAKKPLKVGAGDKLFAHVFLDPKNPPAEVMLQFNDGTWEHRATWGKDVIPWGTAGSPSRFAAGQLPETGKWVRLEVEAAKVGLAPGALINGWAFTQHGGTAHWDKAGIVTRNPQDGGGFESLAAWEKFEKAQTKSTVPGDVRNAIKVAPDKRNDQQKKQILDYFLVNVYPKTKPVFAPLQKEIELLEKQKKDLDNSIPLTMVMAELPNPRETHLLIRGQYDKKGDKVERNVPEVFPPLPKEAPVNRLGLARWLIDPNHPLTSRVAVNRYWQQYFGLGLVKTSEDFGIQGEWPSHPDLLDWLAVEFIESGWNIKKLQRLIVTSAAYRQSSVVTPELVKRDPDNVLLARGPRFRLDAEVVRDAALYTAGLLVEEIGGRSVKPYQPEGIWEAIGFNGSNTRDYKRDKGEDLYRRSLYTFWKRTAPPPSLMAFDAPSRETCVARRARTNTPLQALALMNDTQYVEASRMLAERMIAAGKTPAERLSSGFKLATARQPSEAELKVLLLQYELHHKHYEANKPAAEKLLSIGETKRNAALDPIDHAAYTMVANLILNLDETITKE
ncbi:MAG: PSD1 and planctomycete cytochrome C domain-containing protein [Gemmataceae bacterium]